MLSAHHRRYLADTVEALRLEVIAARQNGSAPVLLEGGQRLDADPLGGTYRFSLIYDSALPEGVPVQLEVAGHRWEAEVLQREGVVVLLLVKRHERLGLPEQQVPSALLHADPWYLVEALQNAIDQLNGKPAVTTPTVKLLDLLGGAARAPVAGARPPVVASLNVEQVDAVHRCASEDVWFVWGPPGTGKTTTLGQVVADAAAGGQSVLVSAHSNVAVDAALIASHRVGFPNGCAVVRAGPAVLPGARATGLSTRELAYQQRPDLKQAIADVVKQLASNGRSVSELVNRWRELMSELRKLEDDILRTASVVFATLSKAVVAEALSTRAYDVGIVDEVSMSYPAQVTYVASLARRRLNVFGDCRQLPPIVQSEAPLAQSMLGRDVFTACRADHPGAPGVTMLKEQFRMHPDIRAVVANFAYGGQLRDAPGVDVVRAPVAAQAPLPDIAIGWLDVGPLGATRYFDRNRGSRFCPVSAMVSLALALEARRSADRVVLLTPYRTQARLLAALVGDAGLDQVEIGTIHRYQGSEAPVVVLDVVDNSGTKVGRVFEGASGERLLNVGISRAQGKLIMVGNGRMPTTGLTRKSIGALSAVQAKFRRVPTRPLTESGPDDFGVTVTAGQPDAAAVRSLDVVAAWAPPSERWIHSTLGAVVEPWEGGHVSWFERGGRLTFVSGAGSSATTFTVSRAGRFAEALSDAITGSPLSRRAALREARGEAPPPVARHDTCGRCGAPAVPAIASRYAIELECTKCLGTRRASDREIGSWLRQVGPRCPNCRGAMRLISGRQAPYGPFFGCSSYPACEGRLALDGLIDAAAHPDPPPPEEVRAPKRRRSAPESALDRRTCDTCFLSKAGSLFDAGSSTCRDCA